MQPFTTARAAECGITPSALRGPHWRHVFRNVWAHVDIPDTRETRFAAVRLVLGEGAFICGLTAAWLYGIDVQDARGEQVWVGCSTGSRLRSRAGCLVREISVDETDLREVDGVLMTTPLRTVFDCARWLSLVEAVVVADALGPLELFEREQLRSYYRRHRGLRGVGQLPRVIELMEPQAESPMETRVRAMVVLAGLPRPQVQIVIRNRSGRIVARSDMGYEQWRLLIEYDGAVHWDQRREDDRRRDTLRELGWTVIVVSRHDYYETSGRTVAQIATALRRAGASLAELDVVGR
jgi:very-short-patch-repair endonuclease